MYNSVIHRYHGWTIHSPPPPSGTIYQEIILAVGPKVAIEETLADFNLVVWNGSPYVYMHMRVRNFGGFSWAVAKDRQTAKFPAVWYDTKIIIRQNFELHCL